MLEAPRTCHENSTHSVPKKNHYVVFFIMEEPLVTPAPRKQYPLAKHDSALGPVLAAHRNDPPHVRVLAVCCKAATAGIPARDVRPWLRSRGDQDVRAAVSSEQRLHRLHAQAVRRAERFSSPEARRDLTVPVAARLAAHLLTPLDPSRGVSKRSEPTARQALAVVGIALLRVAAEHGWDSIQVNHRWLASRMGTTAPTASTALKNCVKGGWLRPAGGRRGHSTRYKICQVPAHAQDRKWGAYAFVDAMADLDWQYPVAEVIAAASHPAVGYEIGARSWLVGLADEAGIGAVDLGMARQTIPGFRRAWLAAVGAGGEVQTIAEALDVHAKATGADGRARQAEQARRAYAEQRVVEREAYRVRQVEIRELLDGLLAEHPVPRRGSSAAARTAWVTDLGARIDQRHLDDVMRRDLAKVLTKRLVSKRHGYSESTASQIAEFVAAGVDGEEAAA